MPISRTPGDRGSPAPERPLLCGGCFRELPSAEFCRDRRSPTGRRDRCRECARIARKRWEAGRSPEQMEREIARWDRNNIRKRCRRRDERRERNRWAKQIIDQLLARGMTYASIAEATGFAESTIREYQRDNPDRMGWRLVPARLTDLFHAVITAERDHRATKEGVRS